jgi:hypothetical protein
MQRNPANNHDPLRRSARWRGVVGCTVAYALVITALLSAVLQAEWVAQVAAGLVGEHCVTDARAAGVDPAAPAGRPDDGSHCALCTPMTGPAVLPAAPAAAFTVAVRAAAPSGGRDRDLIHWRGHPGALPRGPPPAAFAA